MKLQVRTAGAFLIAAAAAICLVFASRDQSGESPTFSQIPIIGDDLRELPSHGAVRFALHNWKRDIDAKAEIDRASLYDWASSRDIVLVEKVRFENHATSTNRDFVPPEGLPASIGQFLGIRSDLAIELRYVELTKDGGSKGELFIHARL